MEFGFSLPLGYVDERGVVHREGVMRRATALDEVEPLGDPRVRGNEAYLAILLLSRVLVRLGGIGPVPPSVVGQLFAPDFTYLQQLYVQINSPEPQIVETACPSCGTHFALDVGAEA
ncbi:MAG: hypothetical protein RLZZ387_5053 [Chloroflexota bacterium]|jgi:hypothetical protein